MAKWTQADELTVTLGTVPILQSTLMKDLGYAEVESFRRKIREVRDLGYDIVRGRFKGETFLAHTKESLRVAHRKYAAVNIPSRMGLSERRAFAARLQHTSRQRKEINNENG